MRGANAIEHERPVMPRMTFPAEHNDIFRRFEATARVRLVMDFEIRCGWAEGTLVAGAFKSEGLDPEPV
jgi:hypothetical protein